MDSKRLDEIVLPRLDELIKACSSAWNPSEFCMRIPADPNHDADLILSEVQRAITELRERIAELEAENAELREQLRWRKWPGHWPDENQRVLGLVRGKYHLLHFDGDEFFYIDDHERCRPSLWFPIPPSCFVQGTKGETE